MSAHSPKTQDVEAKPDREFKAALLELHQVVLTHAMNNELALSPPSVYRIRATFPTVAFRVQRPWMLRIELLVFSCVSGYCGASLLLFAISH